MTLRTMALTEELAARCHRDIADAGPEPGLGYLDDADYAELIDATLASRPDDAPVWLFAYGSLIWKPEIPHEEERIAVARGYHREFCITMTRWRGTPDLPGLMLGLDLGGQCRGMAYRLPESDIRAQLNTLFRREMTAKPATYRPTWLKLATPQGLVSGLAFVANPKGRTYAGKVAEAEAAEKLAAACGHLGSGADYLRNTVKHLEERGIHDRHLWRLQQAVAEILLRQHA